MARWLPLWARLGPLAALALIAATPAIGHAVDGVWMPFPNAPFHTTPPHRHGHSMVLDTDRQELLAFGGFRSGINSSLSDAWRAPLAVAPVFDSLAIAPGPGPRYGHGAIYDPVRKRMLIFDGVTSPSAGMDVWALATGGGGWSPVPASGAPGTYRQGASACYDPVRDRVLVFGGYDGAAYRNEVLVFSPGPPASWSILATSGTPPSPRNYAAMIHDPVRDRLVLFSGNSGPNFQDVHVLDLTASPPAWSELVIPGVLPAVRLAASAIYDPVGDRMLVFGGIAAPATYFGDVWSLALAGSPAWSAIAAPGGPTARHSSAAIYDAAAHRMLIYGGEAFASSRDDLWELSLTGAPAWTRRGGAETVPGEFPPAAYGHIFTYDPPRRRVLAEGGTDGSGHFSSLHELILDLHPSWRKLYFEGTGPTGHGASMAYDPAQDRMICFGGFGPSNWVNDVRVLSLGRVPKWALVPTVGPPSARNYHSAILDPLRNRLVVFGGNQAGTPLNDLWWLDLSSWTWTQVVGSPAPSPRLAHGAVRDGMNDRMLIFGGVGTGGVLGDVWSLDLATLVWTPVPIGGGPGPRQSITMALDSNRHRALVHGGYDGAQSRNDLWELNLGPLPSWRLLDVNPLIPARHGQGMVYDDLADRLVVRGGFGSQGGVFGDTWQFVPADNPTPTLASLTRVEAEPGQVRLEWLWADADGRTIAIERSEGSEEWRELARASFSPEGRLEFTDASVRSGARYGYRIAFDDQGSVLRTTATWIEVPTGTALALAGFHPNPSPGEASVGFSLPAAGEAEIEVVDVAGRRVAHRRLARLEAGPHRVALGGSALAPGVYVLRLSFGDQTRVTRGAVVR